MSIKKSHLTKKAAAGALVALSSFVPQPLMNAANAASDTIKLSGSFITGIQLTGGLPVAFGSVAVTSPTGSIKLSVAGAVTSPGPDAVAVGGGAAGTLKFKAVSTTPNVDITVKGMGPVVLAATVGGHAPAGTSKMTKIILSGIGATAPTLTAAGTTAKKAGYDINTKNGTLKVGGYMTWGAVQPFGQFDEVLTFIISY